jgi:hypothetical protein
VHDGIPLNIFIKIKSKWNMREKMREMEMALGWPRAVLVNMVMKMCGCIRGTVDDK